MPRGSIGQPVGSQQQTLQQEATSYALQVTDADSPTPIIKGNVFNTVVVANTDFFAAALTPTNSPTTFRVLVSVNANGILNLMRTAGGVTVTEHLNENVNLVADCLYEFEFSVVTGQTINLQHVVGGTILSCIVTEVYR